MKTFRSGEAYTEGDVKFEREKIQEQGEKIAQKSEIQRTDEEGAIRAREELERLDIIPEVKNRLLDFMNAHEASLEQSRRENIDKPNAELSERAAEFIDMVNELKESQNEATAALTEYASSVSVVSCASLTGAINDSQESGERIERNLLETQEFMHGYKDEIERTSSPFSRR